MERLAGLYRYYSPKEWQRAAVIFAACAAVQTAFVFILPPSAHLYPASAVALAGLFFGGLRLWPAAFLGLLLSSIAAHQPLPFVYLLPFAQTLQAVLGAYLLQKANIDPLFRKYSDTFYVITTCLLVAVITPLFLLLAPLRELALLQWLYTYTATVFSLLIVTPFLLRWLAKPRFKRPMSETVETLTAFALLIGFNITLFALGITEIGGVLVLYFLLVPFFWIATRLRPRFVTLAVLITAGFALESAIAESTPAILASQLFAAEVFLIVLAIVFYIIVSLEEDRRLNTNLMRSQLATLENVVARVSSESQAKNDFIAILAHELRNPLAPVVSSIELMKIKGARDHEEAESLEVMESSMQTVRRLLDDLLDISRISEGKIAIKREVHDIGHIVRRAVVSTAHHYKERHQTLAFSGSKRPLYVEGDSVRLEQVFSNLLTNASKYSKSGDTVTLSIGEKDGMAEVSVMDQGYGMPADALEAIFLPFQQLDAGKRSKKGLGIGLALVHSFVTMHGGTVRAESAGENKGSTFIVRLPIADGEPEAASIPRSRRELPEEQSGPHVLVVDDNDAAAASIGRLLELQGCIVTYAYSGAQAIGRASAKPHDVVILDIGMQDQDGYAVAKTLRARGYTGTLIALSGYSTPDAKERAQAAGFDQYLVKPTGIAELRKAIPGL